MVIKILTQLLLEIFSEPNNIKNTPSTNVIDLSNVSGSGNSNQQFISVPDDHHPKVDTQKLLNGKIFNIF